MDGQKLKQEQILQTNYKWSKKQTGNKDGYKFNKKSLHTTKVIATYRKKSYVDKFQENKFQESFKKMEKVFDAISRDSDI